MEAMLPIAIEQYLVMADQIRGFNQTWISYPVAKLIKKIKRKHWGRSVQNSMAA